MKRNYCIVVIILLLTSCLSKSRQDIPENESVTGTWKLVSGIQIKGQDSTFIDYTKGEEMIKIYDNTHFAFLRHDLHQGQDSTALFVAGGGRYKVEGDSYTEYLDYCSDREWENKKFELKYALKGDTLITNSIERIEALNIDQINIEKLVRVK